MKNGLIEIYDTTRFLFDDLNGIEADCFFDKKIETMKTFKLI